MQHKSITDFPEYRQEFLELKEKYDKLEDEWNKQNPFPRGKDGGPSHLRRGFARELKEIQEKYKRMLADELKSNK